MSSSAVAESYTLEDLVARAAKSPNVAAAREARAAAHAQLRQAQLLWAPSGDLVVNMYGAPDVKCNSIPDGVCLTTSVTDLVHSANGEPLSERLPIHNFLLGFNVSVVQPLYSFGKIEALQALGEDGLAAADAQLARDRADLVVTSVRAYWLAKTARTELAILQSAEAQLKSWQARIEAQLDGDNRRGYTEADLARLKIALVNMRGQIVDQRRVATAARDAVRVLVDDNEADVDDAELELVHDGPATPLGQWEERAVLRPELRQLRAGLKASHDHHTLVLTQLLPDMVLASGIGDGYNSFAAGNRPPTVYQPQPAGALGGGLALVLHEHLDFGASLATLAQLRHEDVANHAKAKQALGGIDIEVGKAWADMEEARARAETTANAERTARGWVTSVDEDLAVGTYRDLREMMESFRSWVDWRLRHVQAIGDANIAWVVLRRATDLDDKDPAKVAAAVLGRR
ncbi:MAG TPA: TolC family protein [Polyangia bacterium]|nr:TolC family protein [Polyangia bacterium]